MSEITKWVSEAIRDEHFSSYDIKVTGGSEKGENYLSDIIFVTVHGVKRNGENRKIDFAIKASKNNIVLRNKTPTQEMFHNEFYTYQRVLPTFELLQNEKGIKEKFTAYPKCYKCLLVDNQEVLIMQNLRTEGYELHDRYVPMSIEHCKAVLKEYAKLHALSFALKDQNRALFDSTFGNSQMSYNYFFKKTPSMARLIDDNLNTALDSIKANGGIAISEAFRKIAPGRASETVAELWEKHDGKCVFSHGDCWNNNFLFQYEETDKSTPVKVMILDWQLSALMSPAYDVSQFLYAVCSRSQLDHFDELINFYYMNFSSFLRDLGSCPEKLFTFEDLKAHWKIAGLAGLIQVTFLMKFTMCDRSSAPDFKDVEEDSEPGEVINVENYDRKKYGERIQAAFQHYVEYYQKI